MEPSSSSAVRRTRSGTASSSAGSSRSPVASTRRSRSSPPRRRSASRPASATAPSSASWASRRVRPLHAVTRPQANDETAALAVRDATGIFLTGGNQLRLSSTIGGTRLADAILERFRHGAVVAGTSAGASAMSSHMIAFGASGATPKHRMAQIAAGLGVLPGVIIDQHFQQRNRLGRLLSLIAQNPSLLGLGVDEDTAGVVGPDHIMEVIGRGSITVVDGAQSETDAWEVHGHRPLMISGVVLHSLPAGYRFDLRRRERIVTPTLHALPGAEAASS